MPLRVQSGGPLGRSGPYESTPIIDHLRAGVQQRVFEIREVVLVEGELSYEGAMRDATKVSKHRDGLRQNLLESHNRSPCVGGSQNR